MQHRAKIDFKLCFGGACWVPRGLPGASRRAVRARFETQLKINEQIKGFREAPGTSREPPRDPERPPKSTPKRFFTKKGRSKRDFPSFFARKAIVQAFSTIFLFFSQKIDDTSMKKAMHFSQCRSFFWTWRPSRNTVFYISGGTCSFFCFLVFSSKNDQNLMKTRKPWKTYKNDSRRDPKWALFHVLYS